MPERSMSAPKVVVIAARAGEACPRPSAAARLRPHSASGRPRTATTATAGGGEQHRLDLNGRDVLAGSPLRPAAQAAAQTGAMNEKPRAVRGFRSYRYG